MEKRIVQETRPDSSYGPAPRAPGAVQELLRARSGRTVLVMVTDNVHTMVSLKNEAGGAVTVRMHRMFLAAPAAVLDALADWIAGRPGERDLVQEFINQRQDTVRRRDPIRQRPRPVTSGRCYDLAAMRVHLNETYLENRSTAEVTWGRKPTRRKTRTIRLGCYDPAAHRITMSQRLDRRDVPRYMVEYVLFHEMLHEVLGVRERPDGRREIHGPLFKLMEQTYPHYEKAMAFERRKWGG